VKKGETLSSISRKYGCTVNQLKKWNGLKSNTVKVGQKLKIKK
jgi:membrane-bound lytic murein transglycosylase D